MQIQFSIHSSASTKPMCIGGGIKCDAVKLVLLTKPSLEFVGSAVPQLKNVFPPIATKLRGVFLSWPTKNRSMDIPSQSYNFAYQIDLWFPTLSIINSQL